MGKNTSIEWTDHSWPVVNGCRRISAGCERCYAERLTATRLSHTPKYKGLAVFGKNGPRWTGEARLWVPHLDMPLKLKKPSRIFVADMGDLFYEGVSDETIDQVFGVMWACLFLGRGDHGYPGHTFQVLTKRPERMRAYLAEDRRKRWAANAVLHGGGAAPDRIWDQVMSASGPHPRIWLGVSCEDQATADERIPLLLDTPAALRWVSAEPLLGPVKIHPGLLGCVGHLAGTFGNPLINWVVVGGESGPGARPFDLAWARLLVETCREAGVACFVKQLGAKPVTVTGATGNFRTHEGRRQVELTAERMVLNDRKGGAMEEWPPELRVREFPAGPASNQPAKREEPAGPAGAGRETPASTAG